MTLVSVKNQVKAHRIIAKAPGGKVWRVVHVQGDAVCFFSKLAWLRREHPKHEFRQLEPKEALPKVA